MFLGGITQGVIISITSLANFRVTFLFDQGQVNMRQNIVLAN